MCHRIKNVNCKEFQAFFQAPQEFHDTMKSVEDILERKGDEEASMHHSLKSSPAPPCSGWTR